MKPDFADIIARGIVGGVVGVLTQPIVIITLVLVIGVAILARRHRRRRDARDQKSSTRRRSKTGRGN